MNREEAEDFVRKNLTGDTKADITEIVDIVIAATEFERNKFFEEMSASLERADKSLTAASDLLKEQKKNQENRIIELEESIRFSVSKEKSRAEVFQNFIIFSGTIYAILYLVDPKTYQLIRQALASLFEYLNLSSNRWIGVAVAADSAIPEVIPLSGDMLKVLIHVTLALSLFVCLAVFSLHKDAKTRGGALEIVKLLASFFIGVASSR